VTRIAPAGDKVRRVAEDECAAHRTVAQPPYPHFKSAFAASQPSGMTVRDPHGCAGLGGFFHSVTGKLLPMDMKNVVIPRTKHVAQGMIIRRKAEHTESLGGPGRWGVMMNNTTGGEGLALVVSTCTRRLAQDEIYLQLRMSLSQDID
jgi:hypothetical protein